MASFTPSSAGSPRARGVWARLLGLVLIPSVGIGALVVDQVVDRRWAASEALELAGEVDEVSDALAAFVAASEELRFTGILLGAQQFGAPAADVGALLGFDLESHLAESRRAVDESDALAELIDGVGGRGALAAARHAVDDGDPAASDRFHAALFHRALVTWTNEIARVNALDAGFVAPGDLHQSLDSLGDAAVLYRFTQLQLVAAAAHAVPGLPITLENMPDLDALSARVWSATDDLVSSADEHLTGAVAPLIENTTFDDALDDIPRGLTPEVAFDFDAVASVFRAGLERNEVVRDVTILAADDARRHALATGAAARAGYHRGLALLVGFVGLSIALALLVARSIARPLQAVARRAAAISDGDLTGLPIRPAGPRETAVLARTLNDAVGNLRRIERQAAALATGDLAGASVATPHGKLSQLLQRSVDSLARSLRERDELQQRLRHDADHDALTGLANRRAALARLDELLAQSGPPVAVLFLDVDGLKAVNDTGGHAAGDDVLRATAAELVDHAPARALVARIGGDEFVVATQIGDASFAVPLAERIIDALDGVASVDGAAAASGVSVGIALSGPGERADDVLRWADLALYEAKRRGRGTAVLLDDGLRAEVQATAQLDDELRAAMRRQELEVHFQPVVSAGTGALAAVEALVRWRRDGQLVPPDRFIGVAERTGTIEELDCYVLRAATAQLATWRAGPLPALRLAVNVSARTLLSKSLVGNVAAALADAGLGGGCLDLEVTETALLSDLDVAAANIQALRDLGVAVSIDDFGTGYTSVSQLRRLPVGQVKIDRSFVAGLDDNRDRVLVDLVIRIGHVLGVDVVAEGVETEAQLDALRELGCGYVQGYLIGRPLPADRVFAELQALPASSP